MNYEQLLAQLNSTPIKIKTDLMKLKLRDHKDTLKSARKYIKEQMVLKGSKIEEIPLNNTSMIQFINQYVVDPLKGQKKLDPAQKISKQALKESYPESMFVYAYTLAIECYSLIKGYEIVLKHAKDGFIQPKFTFSAGKIYTSSPSLQLPHSELSLFFDCDSYYFHSLEDARRAIENAKPDSQIITVNKTTIYYRNNRYEGEKEKRRQAILKEIGYDQYDFLPLDDYYGEFTLKELGF